MNLLTKSDLKKLQMQDPYFSKGSQKEIPSSELKVLAKFFTPDAGWTWYACSASKDEETGDIQFFGLVDGIEIELGYFWLSQLKEARGPYGLPVERDLHWSNNSKKEITLDELMIELGVG